MTAEKRAATHKQARPISVTTPRITHSSSNENVKKNKSSDKEGRDRLGGKGFKQLVFDCFVIQPWSVKVAHLRSEFCSDGSAVCKMWENKNSTSLHLWQRMHSQLCHAADWPILVDTESISSASSALVKERRFVLPRCSYNMYEDIFFFRKDTYVMFPPLWSLKPCMPFTSPLYCDNSLSSPSLPLLHLFLPIVFFPGNVPLFTRSVYLTLRLPLLIALHPTLSVSPSSSIYFWLFISTTCKPSN